MKLRMLREKDAPLMLEWMHDDSVVQNLKTDFAAKTLEDCITFINTAQGKKESLHLAIVDDNDTYMGTVSLKHINKSSAEFAIVVRKCAMGLGYSQYGMRKIIDRGVKQLGIHRIFWCVSPTNYRAIRFYDKNGYSRSNVPEEANVFYKKSEQENFIWYTIIC